MAQITENDIFHHSRIIKIEQIKAYRKLNKILSFVILFFVAIILLAFLDSYTLHTAVITGAECNV